MDEWFSRRSAKPDTGVQFPHHPQINFKLMHYKTYKLIPWPYCKLIIDYLLDNDYELYKQCYKVDNGWLVPREALDIAWLHKFYE